MIQPTTPTKGATDPDVAELQNRLGVPSASDRCNPDASYRYLEYSGLPQLFCAEYAIL